MDTEAPDFGEGFPSRGERIGPAWREMWRNLSEETWIKGSSLAEVVAPRFEIVARTASGLLFAAVRAGLLEKKIEGQGRTRAAWFRVAPGWEERR